MRKVKDYQTTTEAKALKAEAKAKGWLLIEDQIHFDGKHLVFDDGIPEPAPRNLATEIDQLKARLDKAGISP